jgi:hypothetical protein
MMTPAELKASLIADATAHFSERVPEAFTEPDTRELVIYLMAGFACATLIKHLPGVSPHDD